MDRIITKKKVKIKRFGESLVLLSRMKYETALNDGFF